MKKIFFLAVLVAIGYTVYNFLGGDPRMIARICVESALKFEEDKFYNVFCEEEREYYYKQVSPQFPDIFMTEMLNADWDFSDIDYELLEKSFRVAIVRANGEWSVKTFRGYSHQDYIDLTIRLVKEYGRWKACGMLEKGIIN